MKILVRQVIVGGCVSADPVTVIVNEQLAEFPTASVAVQVTVVVPIAKAVPDCGKQPTVGVERLSLTVGSW